MKNATSSASFSQSKIDTSFNINSLLKNQLEFPQLKTNLQDIMTDDEKKVKSILHQVKPANNEKLLDFGIYCFNEGNISLAENILLFSAQRDKTNPKIHFYQGKIFESKGENFLNDACKYYKLAADAKHALFTKPNEIIIEAQKTLGRVYSTINYGSLYSLNLSLEYYLKAANNKNPEAEYIVGCIYEEKEGYITDKMFKPMAMAKLYYERSSKQGYDKANQKLGNLHFWDKKYDLALDYYKKSNENEFTATTLAHMGFIHENGLAQVPIDHEKAKNYYELAIKGKSSLACFQLACLMIAESNENKDYGKIHDYLMNAKEGLDGDYRYRLLAEEKLVNLNSDLASKPVITAPPIDLDSPIFSHIKVSKKLSLGQVSMQLSKNEIKEVLKAVEERTPNTSRGTKETIIDNRDNISKVNILMSFLKPENDPIKFYNQTEELVKLQHKYCSDHPKLGIYYDNISMKLYSYLFSISLAQSDVLAIDAGLMSKLIQALTVAGGEIPIPGASLIAGLCNIGMNLAYEEILKTKFKEVANWLGTNERLNDIVKHTALTFCIMYEEQICALKNEENIIKAAEFGILRIIRYIYDPKIKLEKKPAKDIAYFIANGISKPFVGFFDQFRSKVSEKIHWKQLEVELEGSIIKLWPQEGFYTLCGIKFFINDILYHYTKKGNEPPYKYRFIENYDESIFTMLESLDYKPITVELSKIIIPFSKTTSQQNSQVLGKFTKKNNSQEVEEVLKQLFTKITELTTSVEKEKEASEKQQQTSAQKITELSLTLASLSEKFTLLFEQNNALQEQLKTSQPSSLPSVEKKESYGSHTQKIQKEREQTHSKELTNEFR